MRTHRGESGDRPRHRDRATYSYVALVCVLAGTLTALGWQWAGPPEDLVALLVLSVLGIFSWRFRETDIGARVQLSFISIVLLSAVVIVGPVGAAVVGFTATLLQVGREPLVVRIFNAGMFTSIGAAGGLVYLLADGTLNVDEVAGVAGILISVGLPLMVADVAQAVLNAVMLAGVMRVANGIPMRSQIGKLLSTTGFAYVGYGIIGFLFVVLWIPAEVGWFSAVLVLAPLFVARWAFVQYGEELRAHDRTLNALVAAVETKDPASTGHSGRVAMLCEWMAESLGLGHREVQDIRTAGMLHDLGKLAIPRRVLRMPRQRDAAEMAEMAQHPLHGVEMLGDISFLKGSLVGVAHHHERYDGRGYPMGLAGEEIPLAARIVAVADAFDALTTVRPYRDALPVQDALTELRHRAGSQFDPSVVAALSRALSRHEWQLTMRSPAELAAAGRSTDHDDPESSDEYAERRDQQGASPTSTATGANSTEAKATGVSS